VIIAPATNRQQLEADLMGKGRPYQPNQFYLTKKPDDVPLIEDLYPELLPEELKAAEESLEWYLKSKVEQYQRIADDPKEYARFKALLQEKNKREESIDRSHGTD
jgi:hypothetical protein